MKLSMLSEFFNLKSMEPLRTNASKFSECRLYLFGSRQKYTCVIVDTVYIYRVVGPGYPRRLPIPLCPLLVDPCNRVALTNLEVNCGAERDWPPNLTTLWLMMVPL